MTSTSTSASAASNGGKKCEQLAPQTPALSVTCRILRSPSHESVTTDLSLFSVSSATSDIYAGRRMLNFGKSDPRGHSPNPENRTHNRPADIPEILWFEEETDLIRNCAALSSAVGLQKSFSTSDIGQLPSAAAAAPDDGLRGLRNAASELALDSPQRSGYAPLERTSRSCSTWVAVGDAASSTSQHAGTPPPPPVPTAADLIRSVNKKVRQNYIRRRLLTTYKAIERLSQSEFNLDRLEVTPSTATRLTVPTTSSTDAAMLRVAKQRAGKNLPLTIRDVERERGKPLSKYERNMMIFNWLHTLDNTAFVEGIQ